MSNSFDTLPDSPVPQCFLQCFLSHGVLEQQQSVCFQHNWLTVSLATESLYLKLGIMTWKRYTLSHHLDILCWCRFVTEKFYVELIWYATEFVSVAVFSTMFWMSSLTTSRLLIVCKTSRNSWKHCYFERSLIDYMDHDNCPMTLKRFWTL